MTIPATVLRVEDRIRVIRGHKVILDADLAELYDVPIKRLNEQVKRNLERFPEDFMFALTQEEWESLRSQIATLKSGRGQHRKYLPYVFTEHGAIMAASVLNAPRAVEVSIYVVRAFIRLREALTSNQELATKLDALEQKTELLSLKQETFAGNTRGQLKQVFETLRQLMAAPADPPKRPIGFVESGSKAAKKKD